MNIQKAAKRYWAPTPKKWRRIGDIILLSTTSLAAAMMGSPFDQITISWTVFILNVTGVLGKIITNTFKEEDSIDTPQE